MKLNTQYLGFDLPNPFLIGASPIVYDVDRVRRLEDAGAAAVVMHSLFEEQIVRENIRGFPEALGESKGIFPESIRFPLHPEAYLEQIQKLKKAVSMPVIASLNGVHLGTWVEYARMIEDAGADALELNLYFTPRSDKDPSSGIETKALNIVGTVRKNINLPMAVKIAPFYTGLPRFVSRLEERGADGLVLFNPFFQPDIDIESMTYKPFFSLSEPHALLLRTRWVATLYGRTRLQMSLTGGVARHEDAIKALMAGATSVQLVSSILKEGSTYLKEFIRNVEKWMTSQGFDSIDQMRGMLSFKDYSNIEASARAGYLQMLQQWEHD